MSVPESHHPRGTTLREALRGNLPLRELCGGLSEGGGSENSRRLWLFPGSVRGFSRKTPGNSREDCWKEARNATNSRISGTGKGEPAGNLGSTLPGPCPHSPCGVFFEIDSSSLLEFFWVEVPILFLWARGFFRESGRMSPNQGALCLKPLRPPTRGRVLQELVCNFVRPATLQKCGSEKILRFSLPKVSWNLAWNFGVKFSVLRFPGNGCATENFTKISRPKRCEKRKISRKFHSAGAQRWNFVRFFSLPMCFLD